MQFKCKYSCPGKSWDEKAAEQDEKLEEQERRGEAAMEELELKLLAKFAETSAIQDEKVAELEQKLTEQEEKIADQERKMTETVKDLTHVRLGVTAQHPQLKSFLGNATIFPFTIILSQQNHICNHHAGQ